MEKIEDFLEVLPNPNSEIYELFLLQDESFDTDKLIKIVQGNSFLVNRILYLANSRYFGFNSKIHSPSKAINLYGINFCSSICVCEIVLDSLKFDLKAYRVGFFEFRRLLDISLKFVFEFLNINEANIKEEIIIPLFLQHIGKFIISAYLGKHDKISYFKTQVAQSNIQVAEYKSTKYNSNELSYEILRKWAFPNRILKYIYSTIDTTAYQTNKVCQILNIINLLFELNNTLTDKSIQTAIFKLKEYGFETEKFKVLIKKYKKEYYKVDKNG